MMDDKSEMKVDTFVKMQNVIFETKERRYGEMEIKTNG